MDIRLLFEQYKKFSLTIISPFLFELTDNNSVLFFHDQERNDLFFIRLNEFLNTSFKSPLNQNKNVSLFTLMEDFCSQPQYIQNEDFNNFIQVIEETKEYFFKKRFYKYYISPHDIVFEISFAELINFQSNYSKHSYYHLSTIKKKLKKHFKRNNIKNYEDEDYNEHLEYFKEAVIDDRLNFNQTNIVEKLGKLFLAYWDLLNSNHQSRILDSINDFIDKNGRLAIRKIDKPQNLNDVEEFFWTIKGIPKVSRNRLSDYIPKTWSPLIEKETNPNNIIEKKQ